MKCAACATLSAEQGSLHDEDGALFCELLFALSIRARSDSPSRTSITRESEAHRDGRKSATWTMFGRRAPPRPGPRAEAAQRRPRRAGPPWSTFTATRRVDLPARRGVDDAHTASPRRPDDPVAPRRRPKKKRRPGTGVGDVAHRLSGRILARVASAAREMMAAEARRHDQNVGRLVSLDRLPSSAPGCRAHSGHRQDPPPPPAIVSGVRSPGRPVLVVPTPQRPRRKIGNRQDSWSLERRDVARATRCSSTAIT